MGVDNVKGPGNVDKNGYQHFDAKDGGWYQRDGDGWHKYQMKGNEANKVDEGDITDDFDRKYMQDNPTANIVISDKWLTSEEHNKRVDKGPDKTPDAIVGAKPTDGSIKELDLQNNPFDQYKTPRDGNRTMGHDINELNGAVKEWNKLSPEDRKDQGKSKTQQDNLNSAYSNVKNDRDNVKDPKLKQYLQSALDTVKPTTTDKSISGPKLDNTSYDQYKTPRDPNRAVGHDINVLNSAVEGWNKLSDADRNDAGKRKTQLDNLRSAHNDAKKDMDNVKDPALKQNLQATLDKIQPILLENG